MTTETGGYSLIQFFFNNNEIYVGEKNSLELFNKKKISISSISYDDDTIR